MRNGTHKCQRHGPTTDVYWHRRKGRTGAPETACGQCSRARESRYTISPVVALWVDGEYQFLRDQGLTPREIGEKHGVKWESFQRTLHRRVGAKEKW